MIFAYKLYLELLEEPEKITLICGGQSPAYYCLAMMNLKIYDPNKVNIIILPYSLFGVNITNVYHLHELYAERIKEKGIKVNDNIIILDGVHSGAGINSLTQSLRHCFKKQDLNIRKYAINHNFGISSIPVDREYELKYEPIFSDSFPRIVVSYRPEYFNSSKRFINNFLIGEKNEIAHMIIDIAKNYPDNQLDDNEWYKLNNPINLPTDLSLANELKYRSFNSNNKVYFTPEIVYDNNNNKVYKCVNCDTISGTHAVMNPNYFSHKYNCININKLPKEEC